ncbi:hypothetical protein ACGFT2_27005 [Streptomyces sp. NPDC048514]|uniref:hypothetical protein n=1 Tax=Streptomyces sp. NPDC048514 TaxID=3365564 RepID=UPI003721A065
MRRPDPPAWTRLAPGAWRLPVLGEPECRSLLRLLDRSEAWTASGDSGSARLPADGMTPEMLIFVEAVHHLVGERIPGTDGRDGSGSSGRPVVVHQEFRKGAHATGRTAGADCAAGSGLTLLLPLTGNPSHGTPPGGGVRLTPADGTPLLLTPPAGTALAVDGSWTVGTDGSGAGLLLQYTCVRAEGADR